VFGKQTLLPIEFQIHTFHVAAELGLNLDEAQKQRIIQLNELGEIRQNAFQRTILIQNQRRKWHDKYIKKKHFNQGIGHCSLTPNIKVSKENL
jgi:hypothetical protein